jgi:hypothetical protein
MRLFTTLFDLAKLPLVVAKDAVFAIPDSSLLQEPFADTRRLCEKLDDDLRAR